MMKLEEDLQAVQDDLKIFIDQQKIKLEKEKNEIGTKNKGRGEAEGYRSPTPRARIKPSPREDNGDYGDHREQKERKPGKDRVEDDEEHRGLNIGQYEREQNRLKDERVREYKLYLAEQELRKTGRVDPLLSDDRSPRRKEVGKDDRDTLFTKRNNAPRTPDKYDAYDEMLRKKREEEKRYRGRYEDPEINSERKVHFEESRKQDRYDKRDTSYNDDELFEWARRKAKLGRQQSATEERKEKNKLPYDELERSRSTAGGAIFGGKDNSSSLQKKKEEYKRELEKQIKEKEEQKHREKLKRMGRNTSSSDIFNTQNKQETQREGMSPGRRLQRDDEKERSPRVDREKTSSRSRFRDDDDRSRTRDDDRSNSRNNDEGRYRRQLEDDRYRPQMRPPYYPNMPQYDPYMAMMYGRYDVPNNMRMGQYGMPGPSYGGMGGYGGKESSHNGSTAMRYDDSRHDEKERFNLRLNGLDDDDSSPPRDSRRERTLKNRRKKEYTETDNNAYQHDGQMSGKMFNGYVMKDDPDGSKRAADSKRADQLAYQQELETQIREKQKREEKEKSKKDKLEAKLDAEIAIYDPWGKGGAGAPVKDVQGNVVADLRTMRQYNQEGTIITPRDQPTVSLDASFNQGQLSARVDGIPSYARGAALKELQGHGQQEEYIQKHAQVQYADYLKQQVEDKKRKELEEKEKERVEEEKQTRRLIEQQERIHREFIEEKESQRRKEEEARQQNEILQKLAEQKKLEIERRKKELDEERQRELKRRSEERRSMEQQPAVKQERSSSPPVPTVAKGRVINYEQTFNEQENSRRPASTLLENETRTHGEVTEDFDIQYLNSIRDSLSKPYAEEKKATGMLVNSQAQKKLFSELTALRHQLQQQERRIQTDLEQNKAKYKELKSKSTVKRNHLNNMEIFDKAMLKKSSVPHKKVQRATEEFKHITDNSSLLDIKAQYQDHPTTSSTLDIQQRDFIRQQEQKLSALRKAIDDTSKHFMIDVGNQRPATGQRRASKKSLLDSDSKFISIDYPTEEPVILSEQTPGSGRKSSARERRRWDEQNKQENLVKPNTPGGYSVGSMTTTAVEQIAAKNEERLRKLEAQSKSKPGNENDNPEDMLNEFVNNRQSSAKGRPKSGEDHLANASPGNINS